MENTSIRNADISLLELMNRWPETLTVLIQNKMLCIGCAIAPYHTVQDACDEHQVDQDVFWTALETEIGASNFSVSQ